MPVDREHAERSMREGLALYRTLIDNGEELMPLFMLHCPAEVVPVLLYRLPPDPREAGQQLYQLGAVLGLAWEVGHYVVAAEATIRIATVERDKVAELYENPPDDLPTHTAISVFYLADGEVVGAGYQTYKRIGRKCEYAEPWISVGQTSRVPSNIWHHFDQGQKAGTMMATVSGAAPAATRERALGLLRTVERPRKERGIRVMEPGKLVMV